MAAPPAMAASVRKALLRVIGRRIVKSSVRLVQPARTPCATRHRRWPFTVSPTENQTSHRLLVCTLDSGADPPPARRPEHEAKCQLHSTGSSESIQRASQLGWQETCRSGLTGHYVGGSSPTHCHPPAVGAVLAGEGGLPTPIHPQQEGSDRGVLVASTLAPDNSQDPQKARRAEPAGQQSSDKDRWRVAPPAETASSPLNAQPLWDQSCSRNVIQLRNPRPSAHTTNTMSIGMLKRSNGNFTARSSKKSTSMRMEITIPVIQRTLGMRSVLGR